MSRVLHLSRKALADFFVMMEAQHAHWYCIKSPTIGEANCLELKCMFPPLSSLLNIQDEVLMSMLKVAGLLYQQGNMLSPLLHAWEDLFAKFKLKNELTTFSISGNSEYLFGLVHGVKDTLQLHPRLFGQLETSIDCQSFISAL
jgi:hypothetical protein